MTEPNKGTSDASTIRRARNEDEAAILELLRVSMGEEAVAWSDDYWRWKHRDNPFGASPVLLAEAEGQLVGLRAFMRWTWHSGGRAVPAVRAVDTATHPDFRGRGIFKRLTLQLRDEMGAEGVALVYNTPNAQSRPGYLKMGWSLVGKPALWIRPVHPIRLARALRREGLGGEESEAPDVHAESAAEVFHRPNVQALVEAASARSRGAADRRLHTDLTLGYLTWRYVEIPGFAYQVLHDGEGAEGALIVLRARQRGALREARLCDIVVGPTRRSKAALRRLLRHVPSVTDVDVVIAMASGRSALHQSLLRSGYLPAPRTGPILTTYPFPPASALPDPTDLSSWGASIGDLEIF